jgi:hypothetical protein
LKKQAREDLEGSKQRLMGSSVGSSRDENADSESQDHEISDGSKDSNGT